MIKTGQEFTASVIYLSNLGGASKQQLPSLEETGRVSSKDVPSHALQKLQYRLCSTVAFGQALLEFDATLEPYWLQNQTLIEASLN